VSDDLERYLGRQVASLSSAQPDEGIFLVIRILRAIDRESRLSIYLEDMRAEAQRLLADLQEREISMTEQGLALLDRAASVFERAAVAGWEAGQGLEILNEKRRMGGRMWAQLEWSRFGDFRPGAEPTAHDLLELLRYELAEAHKRLPPESLDVIALVSEAYTLLHQAKHLPRLLRIADRSDPTVAFVRVERAIEPIVAPELSANQTVEWELLRHGSLEHQLAELATGPVARDDGLGGGIGGSSGVRAIAQDLIDSARVAIEELIRRLGGTASRLALVRRFKARAELLDRERLAALADESQEPEGVLRDELARYLFDQGLLPLTEVTLGNVRPDLADLRADEAFYVEAKQYTRGPRGVAIAGARQVWGSASRLVGPPFGLREAFLVIFRRAGGHLLPPDHPVSKSGLRLHIVVIDIGKDAGSRQRRTPQEVRAEDLVDDAP